MKRFFDTSVLVASVMDEHEHHEASFRVLSTATRASAFCAVHNLVEFYATLTRYPGKQRLTPEQALLAVDEMENRLTLVTLDIREHLDAIRRFASMGIIGGTIYDALIAACALKSRADELYTWNVGHFMLLGEDVSRRVRTP